MSLIFSPGSPSHLWNYFQKGETPYFYVESSEEDTLLGLVLGVAVASKGVKFQDVGVVGTGQSCDLVLKFNKTSTYPVTVSGTADPQGESPQDSTWQKVEFIFKKPINLQKDKKHKVYVQTVMGDNLALYTVRSVRAIRTRDDTSLGTASPILVDFENATQSVSTERLTSEPLRLSNLALSSSQVTSFALQSATSAAATPRASDHIYESPWGATYKFDIEVNGIPVDESPLLVGRYITTYFGVPLPLTFHVTQTSGTTITGILRERDWLPNLVGWTEGLRPKYVSAKYDSDYGSDTFVNVYTITYEISAYAAIGARAIIWQDGYADARVPGDPSGTPQPEHSLTISLAVGCKARHRPPTIKINYPSTGGFSEGHTLVPSDYTITPASGEPAGVGTKISVSAPTTLTWNDCTITAYAYGGYGGEVMESETVSEKIAVYTYPRKMDSNGFTYNFDLPATFLDPGFDVKISWGTFSINKNLGKFDSYMIYLYDVDNKTKVILASGSNNPEKSNSVSRRLDKSQLSFNHTYQLVLGCTYNMTPGTISSANGNEFYSTKFAIAPIATVGLSSSSPIAFNSNTTVTSSLLNVTGSGYSYSREWTISSSADNPSSLVSGGRASDTSATYNIKSSTTVSYKLKISKSGYTGTVERTATKTISCRLLSPTIRINYPSATQQGFSIGSALSSSNYTIVQNTSSPVKVTITNVVESVPTTLDYDSWIYAHSEAPGYVKSNAAGRRVEVFDYPRNMSSNGFTYSLGGLTHSSENGYTVSPRSPVVVNWSAYPLSKNWGNFNHYKLYLRDTSSGGLTLLDEGSNDPSKSSSKSYTLQGKGTVGRKYCIVLYCEYSGSKGIVRGDTFTSLTFTLGTIPNAPTIIYPSTSSFYTANQQVRIVFYVTNIPGESEINNIQVHITQSSGGTMTSTYQGNPGNFLSTIPNKPTTLPSGTWIDFTVPSGYIPNVDGSKVTLRISCSTGILWSPESTLSLTFVKLNYMTSGRKLLQSDMLSLRTSIKNIVPGYSNVINDFRVLDYLPGQSGGKYLVQDGGDNGYQGILKLLTNLYSQVVRYSKPPTSVIDLNKLNTSARGQKVQASSSFNLSNNTYIPIGNYFNYIMYILKFML